MKRIDILSRGWTGLALAVLIAGGPTLAASAQDAAPLVQTKDGPVQGVARDGVRVFTAIPYAAPPVGPLRFHSPQRVAPWTQTLVATKPLPQCLQIGGQSKATQSEDCLYLNIWVPENTTPGKPLAVMVWSPAGNPQGTDGSSLARNGGVIVVTNTRRLGVLASMNDPVLNEGRVQSGDYALKDQQEALRWLQRNIASFGGDPNNITLFGQSAGASFVAKEIAAPSSKGLFQKAILESSGLGAVISKQDPEAGEAVTKAVGCAGKPDVAACLRALPASAFAKVRAPRGGYGGDFLPLDLPEALKSGKFNRVALMDGTNVNEGAWWVQNAERKLGHPLTESDLPVVAPDSEMLGEYAAVLLAEYPSSKYPTPDMAMMHAATDYRQACFTDATRRAVSNYVPVYAYEVTEPNPAQREPDPKITNLPNTPQHASEIAYVFGRNAAQSPRAAALSARFQRYWANFAKFGAPDPTGKEWPRFTAQNNLVMGLEEPPKLSTDFAERHNCAWLAAKGIIH